MAELQDKEVKAAEKPVEKKPVLPAEVQKLLDDRARISKDIEEAIKREPTSASARLIRNVQQVKQIEEDLKTYGIDPKLADALSVDVVHHAQVESNRPESDKPEAKAADSVSANSLPAAQKPKRSRKKAE